MHKWRSDQVQTTVLQVFRIDVEDAHTIVFPLIAFVVMRMKHSHLFAVFAQDAEQNIGSFNKVGAACDHHRRPNLCFQGARKRANDDITGLQRGSSGSSASSRRTEAAVNSFRSSSDQESDQSILVFGRSAANRSAKTAISDAASGGRRRNACNSEVSRALSCCSIDSLFSIRPLPNGMKR